MLHRSGWTTQIPKWDDFVILEGQPPPDLPAAIWHPRPLTWFEQYQEEIFHGHVWQLTPYSALVHAWSEWSDGRDWRPDPDDLEWDEIDISRLMALFATHGVEWPALYR